jgi:hypothetical protein
MKTTPKRKPVRMPSLAIVTADFNAGMTNEQMSEKYDVAVSAVSAYLSRNSLHRRIKAFIPADDTIIECLEAGMACHQIAELHGGKADNISRYIRQHGLRKGITPKPDVKQNTESKGLRPTPFKVINHYGVSIPRIPTLHGVFEVRP